MSKAEQSQIDLKREYNKRQRKRSITIAVGLGILVAIFYALTIVKLGPAVFQRNL